MCWIQNLHYLRPCVNCSSSFGSNKYICTKYLLYCEKTESKSEFGPTFSDKFSYHVTPLISMINVKILFFWEINLNYDQHAKLFVQMIWNHFMSRQCKLYIDIKGEKISPVVSIFQLLPQLFKNIQQYDYFESVGLISHAINKNPYVPAGFQAEALLHTADTNICIEENDSPVIIVLSRSPSSTLS